MNWIKASKEVFEQYLGEGATIGERQLSEQYSKGEFIMHFETGHSMPVACHMDSRVTLYTEDAMRAYLEFVEGDGQEE